MAETIYLNDGSTVVLPAGSSRREVLRQLIYERIGSDAAREYESLISDLEEAARVNELKASEEEQTADGYLRLCRDALENFEEIKSLLNKNPLDRVRLKNAIYAGYNDLHNNL